MAKLFIVALLFLCCFYGYHSTQVTFGISVSTQAPSEFLNTNGKQILAGLQFFAQKANTWNITINKNESLTFAIKSMEDYGNRTIVIQNYQTMLADPEINFFLGPVSSPLSSAAKSVTEPAGRLLLGTKVGSASFYTGAEFAYSVTTSPPRYATTTFPEFRINGIRKIILVVEQTPFQIDIGKGFVANAEDFSIEILQQYNVITDTLNGIDDAFIKNITDVASLIRDIDYQNGTDKHTFDAVVIASFTNVGRYFLEAIRKLDYTPKAVYISSYYVPDFLALDPSLVAFVSGCDVIAPGIDFRGDYFGTYKEFLADFDATMDPSLGPADANQAIGAVAGLLLMNAIQSANSLDTNEVTRALGRINEDTFFGPYQFGADHSQLRFVPFLQFVPNSDEWIQYARKEIANYTSVVNVVGPSRVQLQNLVYPMPTWSERIYNPTTTPAEWAMFALAIVGIVFSIALMIVVIANRKNKIIRASSALFLVYVLFGTCMSYASIFSWNLSWLDKAACVLTPLLLGIGFTITFGCLFAKSWRIHSLYNDKRLTIKAITDAKLSIITAVVVGIEAVICIIIAIFGSNVQLVVTDPNRPAFWYTDCSVDMANTPVSFAFVIIALGYNAILMGYGIYLAVRIRSVPHKVYNESRLLAFVIYVLVIISALITALQFVGTISREERFIIRSIGIFVANMTTIIVVFGNKIHLMAKLKKDGDDGTAWGTNKNTTAMTSSGSHPQSSLSENSSKLENELNELRKEIDKLRTENEYLKQKKNEPANKPAASGSSDETTEK